MKSPCQTISLQVLARCKFDMNSGTFKKTAMTEMKEQNRNSEASEDAFSKYVRIYSVPKRTRQLIHPVGRCMIVGDSLQQPL